MSNNETQTKNVLPNGGDNENEARIVARKKAAAEHRLKPATTWQMLRISAGNAAYRVTRLSVELLLILRVQELDFPTSRAGIVFLAYSISTMLSGIFFMWYPSICFGSMTRAVSFFAISVSCMVGGFVTMFNVQKSLGLMIVGGVLCGSGVASWFINYQTIINLAFPKNQLGAISRMRQLFESIGFLLPSVCLAIVQASKGDEEDHDPQDTKKKSVVQLSASVLGIVALLLTLLSADQIISRAAKGLRRQKDTKGSVSANIWKSLKHFFGSSIIVYFMLYSLLLAASSILMGFMSMITKHYFGLHPDYLWIAALGFPLGGFISVGFRMTSKTSANNNAKSMVMRNLIQIILLHCFYISISSTMPPESTKLSKTLLFFFGFVVGAIYSVTFCSVHELWMVRLKSHSAIFVSRAGVINNIGQQAIMAFFFALQSILVENFVETEEEEEEASLELIKSIIFFAPIVVVCGICLLITKYFLPYPKDLVFGWPVPPPFTPFFKTLMNFFRFLGVEDVSTFLFAEFCNYRTGLLGSHLGKSVPNGGPPISYSTARLEPTHLSLHLEEFDKLRTKEEWFYCKSQLCNIILDNDESLTKRLELVEKAKERIWITTWAFDGDVTGEKLADALVKRSKEDKIDVRVIVDAANLYYIYEKSKLTGIDDMGGLRKLYNGGVDIRMLDTWHKAKTTSPYVVGTHRKMLVVDNDWVLTGGRNTSDAYLATDKFHFEDVDVLLRGNFQKSTITLYKSLWYDAKPIKLFSADSHVGSDDVDGRYSRISNRISYCSLVLDIKLDKIENLEKEMKKDLSLASVSDIEDGKVVENQEEGEEEINEMMKLCDMVASSYKNNGCEINMRSSYIRSSVPGRESVVLRPSSCNNNTCNNDIHLFQLDHKAGRIDGQDIIYSTLLFLIETATESIDLIFGYIQLFEDLDNAIARAVQRGVRIRLVTNSSETTDLDFFNDVFRKALNRCLELGIEIYIPPSSPPTTDSMVVAPGNGGGNIPTECHQDQQPHQDVCLHYKTVIVDGKAVMVGSWNCVGTSVFYDADFSVVMMSDSDTDDLFRPFGRLIDESIDCGRFVPMKKEDTEGFTLPWLYHVFGTKNSAHQMKYGY